MADESEVTYVPLTARHAHVDRVTWWDTEQSLDFGAGPLLYRCMREYYWTKDFALRVLKGYRQYLELKKILEDWDCKIVAPSGPIVQMWYQHILDVTNYCHDCLLICGRVVGNDPDGGLDEWAQGKRILATKQLLRARFENDIDLEIWRFDSLAASKLHAATVNAMSAASRTPSPAPCVSGLTADERKYGRHDMKKLMRVASRTGDIHEEKKDDDSYGNSPYSSSAFRAPRAISHEEMLAHEGVEVEQDLLFTIRVRTLKGSIYALKVKNSMTIAEVKSMIQNNHGIAQDTQHLLFYGKVLEDRKTIGEYSVPANSGLQLLIRSRRPTSDF